MRLVDFREYSRYFQEIYPSQGTQAMLTQRQRKFELFNPKPSQRSRLEEQQRQGAAVQPLPNDYITTPVCTYAALQWQRSSTEEQQACSSSQGG